MNLDQFDYILPSELIAQKPAQQRDESRLLVVNRQTGLLTDSVFKHIQHHLRDDDFLVMNNTQVFPARLHGFKEPGGAAIEMLLLEKVSQFEWIVIAYRASRLKQGTRVVFSPNLQCEVLDCLPEGKFRVLFQCNGEWDQVLSEVGEIPLPPYIERLGHTEESDRDRYQTVYAQYHEQFNSAAAPTAGLHFTPELLKQLQHKGVEIAYVTLRVGLDTFLPMRVDRIQDHKMHQERYFVSEETSRQVAKAKQSGRRIVAVGTTSVRVLESSFHDNSLVSGVGSTDLFIYPGFQFQCVDALITNFHLPKSTLLLMISCFMGQALRIKSYEHAIQNRYRFFSYGDAMFIE